MRDEIIRKQAGIWNGELKRIDLMLENAKEREMALKERKQIVLDAGDSDSVTWEDTTVAGTGNTTAAGVDHTVGAGTTVEGLTGAGLTEVEYLDGEIEKLENERNHMIMERADFVRMEMHLRMLLELVDGMNPPRSAGTQGVDANRSANTATDRHRG